MPIQARLIRPQFREPNKAKIKRIFRHIVGEAPIIAVCSLDESSQMWKNVDNPFRRESKYSEHGNFWIHGLSLRLHMLVLRPNA